jgi:DNA-binding transcriptional regulator GbsR (MarR family)
MTAANAQFDEQDLTLAEMERAIEYNRELIRNLGNSNQDSRQLRYITEEMQRMKSALEVGLERYEGLSARIDYLLDMNAENHQTVH